jgi:hypothetical protein
MKRLYVGTCVLVLALAGCASTGAKVREPVSAGKPAGLKPSLVSADGLVLPGPEDPAPIRMPAQVMRVWIAPWEDSRGDLHAPGYLFTEIVPRRWSLGVPATDTTARLIRPLQVEPRKDAPPASRPAPTKGRDPAVRERGRPRAGMRLTP